jgi:molecular chaperone DnaK
MPRAGIDFGTTNSIIVAYDKKKHEFLYFNYEKGPVPTSSTVWYHDGEVIVGIEARQNIHTFSNVEGHHFEKSIKLRLGNSNSINIFGNEVQPYKVAADILKHLKKEAKDRWHAEKSGVRLDSAVFTVPIKFTGKQRMALRQAANEAGIEVTTFIHEPFAAIIGHYFSVNPSSNANTILKQIRDLEGKYLLTIDWGGGTLDISVVKIEQDRMIEVGTSELTGYAGDKFDEYIAEWAWDKFVTKYKGIYREDYLDTIKNDKWDRLLATAEKCKIELSLQPSTNFFIESLTANENFEGIDEIITRNDFSLLLKNTIEKACNRIDTAIKIAGINDLNLHMVLLTGGSCNIPVIHETMKQKFGHRVRLTEHADLIIAQGAAVIAEMQWIPFLTKDVLIELSDDTYWPLFERDTILVPGKKIERNETFTCVDQRNRTAKIIVCEGLSQVKHRNLKYLKVDILGDSRFRDDIYVGATIDENIVLNIKAHSIFVNGYKTIEYSGIDENFSKTVNEEIDQLCFGLNFGGYIE